MLILQWLCSSLISRQQISKSLLFNVVLQPVEMPLKLPPLISRQAMDSSVCPPTQDIVSSSAKISYHIQSDISSSAPANNETLNLPPTNAALAVSEQITQELSRAIVFCRGRRRKTQAELLKEHWLALPFFNNMARRPRLVELRVWFQQRWGQKITEDKGEDFDHVVKGLKVLF